APKLVDLNLPITRAAAVAILASVCLVPACAGDDGSSTDTEAGSTGADSGSTSAMTTMTTMNAETAADDTAGSTGGSTGPDTTGGGSSGGDSSGSGSTGAAVECGGANVCVGEVPDGWSGPVALRTLDAGDDLPRCGGQHTDLQFDAAFSGLSGDDYTCECSCGAGSLACAGSADVLIEGPQVVTTGAPCGLNAVDTQFNSTVVAGAPETFDEDEIAFDQDELYGVTIDEVMTNVAGECEPTASQMETPAAFAERTIGCASLEEPEGVCDGAQTCVPRPAEPFEAQLCIWADGEAECPADYPELTLYHGDFDDSRGCSECTCGAGNGSCSDPSVDVSWHFENGLGATGITSPANFEAPTSCDVHDFCPVGICILATYSLAEVTFDPGTLTLNNPAVPCSPSAVMPIGEVTPTLPVTVCCAEL
ncbi:MAG: hypothetical protein AAF721_13035, partial [Myxococcota bacterium]